MSKKKIVKKTVRIARTYRNITAILVVAIVSFLGVLLLNSSHASTPYVSTEAETGQLAGNACKQSDANASGGTYVEFGGTACTPATSPPPTTGSGVALLGLWDQGNYTLPAGITQQLSLVFGNPGNNYCTYNPSSDGAVAKGTTIILSIGACTVPQAQMLATWMINNGQSSGYVRPMWEMNQGGNSSWFTSWNEVGLTSAKYISTWIAEYNAMKAIAPNIKFIWCPNDTSPGTNLSTDGTDHNTSTRNDIDTYPGDAYVDYIGVDVYDWWSGTTGDLPAYESFAVSHGKPMAIPEWGLNYGSYGDDTTFMTNMINFIKAPANNVYLQSYFDCPASECSSPESDLSASPKSAALYNAGFQGD